MSEAPPVEPPTPSELEVREQLSRVLASRVFSGSERMRSFLNYIVDHTLRGKRSALKEYAIAVAVYDKPETFDSRLDSIVRVEAGRLRSKLREYYATAGKADRILITLPPKGYVPTFGLTNRGSVSIKKRIEATADATIRGTQSSEAYHWYMRGRHYWNKRTRENLEEAIRCFERASVLDPNFVLPLAGLADCFASRAWLELQSPQTDWLHAEQAATRALSLEPELSQALSALAYVAAVRDWNWQRSETLFESAIASDPKYATAYHWYAVFCLAPQRRLQEALSRIRAARRHDPISPAINSHLGRILYFGRDFDGAMAQCRKALELDPTFAPGHIHCGMISLQLSHVDEAVKFFRRAHKLSGGAPWAVSAVGFALGKAGRNTEALQTIDELNLASKQRYVSEFEYALVRLGLKDNKRALAHLRRAAKSGCGRLAHLKVDPIFDALTFEDGYLALLHKMGLS